MFHNAEKASRNELKVRAKNQKLVALLKEKENQRNLVQGEVNNLRDSLGELRSELEKARKLEDGLSEENRLVKQEVDELKINYKSASANVKVLNLKLEQKTKEFAQDLSAMEDEAEEMNSQIKTIKNRLAVKESELETKDKKLDAVIEQKNKFELSLREVHLEMRKAQELLEERNKQLAELKAKQAATEKLLKEEVKKYHDLKAITTTQIRLLKDEKVQLQEEIDAKSHRVNSLEAETADLNEEVSVMRKHKVLDKMKQGKLQNDLQSLEEQKDQAEHNLQQILLFL